MITFSRFKTVGPIALFLAASVMSAQAKDTVTIYATNNTASVDAMLTAVAKQAPDLDVQVVSGATGAMLARVEAEKTNPHADVLWTAGISTIDSYDDYFQPHENTAGLPADMMGPNNLWTGANVHVMVLMVNKNQLGDLPEPKTWSDLFKPEWKGKFVFGDPSNSSGAYAQLFGLYKLFGQDGLEKLARNAVVVKSSTSAYTSPASGEFPVGITSENVSQSYVSGGQTEIKLIYPSEGTFLSPEGMAIVKGAPHLAAARRLMDVLASKDAQAEILKATFRRPANPSVDVKAIVGLPDLKDVKIIDVDQKEAAASRPKLLELWKEIVSKQ